MKLQLDFDNKIITIEEKVNLGEFFSKLEELLPDLKWREFDLEMKVINYWYNPIPWDQSYPTYPWTTYNDSGIYNIDLT